MAKFKAGNKTFTSAQEAIEHANTIHRKTGAIVSVEEVKTKPSGAFNGFPSWNAWNVSLWINNEESLYRMAQDCVLRSQSWKGFSKTGPSPRERAATMMFEALERDDITHTPDGAPYSVTTIKAAMRGM